MKVSICVPVYGVEKYILRCADSLFNQTYKDLEFIFVNDCSKDNSMQLLLEYIEKHSEKKHLVKIINHETNKGLCASRNTAVSAATGDFILHVDSDDYIDLNCVEECVKTQLKTGADIVTFDMVILNKNYSHKFVKQEFSSPKDMIIKVIKFGIQNSVWSNMIRRSLYTDNNIEVIGNNSMGEDLQVLPRLLYYSNIVANLHSVYYYYDKTNVNSYTNSFSEDKANQVWDVLNILNNFFSGKDKDIQNAITIRFLISAVEQIKCASVAGGHKEFIKRKLLFVKKNLPKYRHYISLPHRIGIYIPNSYIRSLYFKCAVTINKFLLCNKKSL